MVGKENSWREGDPIPRDGLDEVRGEKVDPNRTGMKGTLDNPGGREYKHVDAITPIYCPMEPTKYQRLRGMGPCLDRKARSLHHPAQGNRSECKSESSVQSIRSLGMRADYSAQCSTIENRGLSVSPR